MKILVFSDTHGHYERMIKISQKAQADAILFLGDCLRDFESFSRGYKGNAMLISVKGNCDSFDGTPEERIFSLGGKKILMLHGHTRGVKLGTGVLEAYAANNGCDIAFYGHTHIPDNRYISDFEKPFYIFNPGTLSVRESESTFGYVEIASSGIICNIAKYGDII